MNPYLTAESARRVVERIGELLQRELLIARPDGRILAASRSGLADRMLDLRTQELSVREGEEAPPLWAGTLLPVVSDGDVVCVIGLTGDIEDMPQSSRILRAMTALLFTEDRDRDHRAEAQERLTAFLEDWLFSSCLPDAADLGPRARALGLDPNRTRIAGLLRMDPRPAPEEETPTASLPEPDDVIRFLRERTSFGEHPVLMAGSGSRIVVLLDSDRPDEMRALLKEAQDAVRSAFPLTLTGGIGRAQRTLLTVPESVREAERAARYAARAGGDRLAEFEDITLELLLQDLPDWSGRSFAGHVFRGLSDSDRRSAVRLLSAYFATDGSLTRTAAALGVHKNTLQYRLRRLEEKTGRDPRRLRDGLSLYLATRILEQQSPTDNSGGTA